MHPIRNLPTAEFAAYCDHLLRLDAEDRRRRFGNMMNDTGIHCYADQLDPEKDRVFAYLDRSLRVVAAAHVAIGDDRTAELGFSVEKSHRRKGIGRSLFQRAILFARNHGVERLYVSFLPENGEMARLARSMNMKISGHSIEIEAYLIIPRANAFSLFGEALAEHAAMVDTIAKSRGRTFERLMPIPATRLQPYSSVVA